MLCNNWPLRNIHFGIKVGKSTSCTSEPINQQARFNMKHSRRLVSPVLMLRLLSCALHDESGQNGKKMHPHLGIVKNCCLTAPNEQIVRFVHFLACVLCFLSCRRSCSWPWGAENCPRHCLESLNLCFLAASHTVACCSRLAPLTNQLFTLFHTCFLCLPPFSLNTKTPFLFVFFFLSCRSRLSRPSNATEFHTPFEYQVVVKSQPTASDSCRRQRAERRAAG